MKPTICLSDDRVSDGVGLRLAVASIRKAEPEARIVVHCALEDTLSRMVFRELGEISVLPPPEAGSWNGKPSIVTAPFTDGSSKEVWWLDSDIIVTKPFLQHFREVAGDALIIASEAWSGPTPQGAHLRCPGWEYTVGRKFRRTLNSSVLRFLPQHLPLLTAWQETLDSEQYRKAQQLPLLQRPLHVIGDQEPLNALLASTRFSDLSVHVLETGDELIHAGHALSYSVAERLRGLTRRGPFFLHAGGGRPWKIIGKGSRRSPNRLSRLMQELSDYVIAAKSLRGDLRAAGDDSLDEWVDYRSPLGTVMRLASLGNRGLRGFPVTAAASTVRYFKPRGPRGPAGW